MYAQYWGLHQNPFTASAEESFFVSPSHDEASARLDYLIAARRRLGIVVGESGTGKSHLFRWYCSQLNRRQHHACVISLLQIDGHEFLWRVAEGLHARPALSDAPFALWRKIHHQLLSHRYGAGQVVLLLDDADEAQREVLDGLVRLVHIDPSPDLRLSIVLAAGAERSLRLGKRLLEHSGLRIELDAWAALEVEDYLRASFARAGCEQSPITPEAVARLHLHSAGNPRRVSQLADLALLAAAGQQLREVSAATIDAVQQQLIQNQTVAPVAVS